MFLTDRRLWTGVRVNKNNNSTNIYKAHSQQYKGLGCHKGTARRAMSVELWSTAVKAYEKSHMKRLAVWVNDVEGNSRSS